MTGLQHELQQKLSYYQANALAGVYFETIRHHLWQWLHPDTASHHETHFYSPASRELEPWITLRLEKTPYKIILERSHVVSILNMELFYSPSTSRCHEWLVTRQELLSLFLPDNAPPVAYELLESILNGGNETQLRAAILDACEESSSSPPPSFNQKGVSLVSSH